MILYRNTKGGFKSDVRNNIIAEKIENAFFEHCFNHNNDAEFRSWANSMQYMCNVLDDNEISDDCSVAIEYQIPLTSKRIDFLISGLDDNNKKNVIVVELKQWESCEYTLRKDVVRTFTGGANRYVAHPSYQAYSYAQVIQQFNESVSQSHINIIPCAYLHNYKEEFRKNIDSTYYADAVSSAPIFLNRDAEKLRNFIKLYVRKASGTDLLMIIENGKLRPSKSLQDTLSSVLKGNREFVLIDEQKVAFETIKNAVKYSLDKNEKYTFIVKGGPGTGKSVVAIQLLCELIKSNYTALYVTKNSAPRNVYFAKLLKDKYRLAYLKTLFKGSGSFVDAESNVFDCILADEAHRLQMKSGMFQNIGESQIKEIINAAKISVFFIDEEQKVTTSDAGSVQMIRDYARQLGSTIVEGDDFNLISQFRCNGSDGYLAFLNNLLELHPSPNVAFDMDYDIRVFDDPCEMREELRIKNMINNKSRLLAGYCYEWASKNNPNAVDINIKNQFLAQWNFNTTNTWAIDEESFDQVGCIHTSQGLEFDYVGVIIGKDLIYKDGKVQTDYTQRAHSDASLKGIKTSRNYELADTIIRNTYKTLLSRGQKGCYIYCEDEALAKHIREMLQQPKLIVEKQNTSPLSPILDEVDEMQKYIAFYPVYSLHAACGRFGHDEAVSQLGWMAVNGYSHKDRSKFIVQACGHSMESKIQDGDYCLFQRYTGGSREGKIVLAEHMGEVDTDYEGAYSIKVYHSTKSYDEDGNWQHEEIVLKPLNPSYEPIHINAEDSDGFRIIGELVEVLPQK